MHITASVLIFWFVALCNRCEVDGARSLESSAAVSGAASSVKAAQRAASRDDDDIDEDDIDDDEGREEADDDDVGQELDDAEDRYRATLCVAFLLRFERNEKTLEDAEDSGLKEDLEEEASEEAYARAKAESGEGNKEPEDAAKARIRRLMDDLVAASLELREINRELDEL
ncbi:hypothetical protein BBBOND_0402380 [Babesia bigemina]|uniref:Uncharacterized protein n=1 Tax=Babesia bigemina TaxID=5866 RepID=A0A061DER7_BABBI|nr:hypothetical protein BBBOND_0402380 [Babesia bigemina]CDR97750.1 hypothetical protein BBBOND_0402380 [Babesia bigemina]|eukprot:XP_012769936.1 hypothetical protein BBBOND_0402380 [Babesia bigemina]